MKIDIHQGQLGPMAYIIMDGTSAEIEKKLEGVRNWLAENMPDGGFRWFEEETCLLAVHSLIKFEKMIDTRLAADVSIKSLPFFVIFDTDEHAVLFKVWMDG